MDKKNSARAKHIDFIILDIVAIELAFLLSCTIFYERVHNWLSIYRNIDILIVVLYIIIMMFNPYHRSILKRGYLKEIWRVIVVNTELMLALLAILFMLKESATYSRVVLGSFAIFDTVFMFVIRSIWKRVLHRRFRNGKENSNVLILSGREGLSDLITALEKNNSGYYIYKGIVLLGNDKGSSPDEKDAFNNSRPRRE